MNTNTLSPDREAWLSSLARAMAPTIAARGQRAFPPYRVACGFPSQKALMTSDGKYRIGECWSALASKDGHAEIFVSPVLDDPRIIAAVLAHEMIHAALPDAGHKAPFQKVAAAIGHIAPFTQCKPTDDFYSWAQPFIDDAGPYPHAKLNACKRVGAPKKQAARLLKAECEECGYVVRVTKKWIVEAGAPHCPNHGAMLCEGA